ncbi:hypothetical protein [Paenibacillus tyrfis]|uniref:hypothetical protein n=1 Tax=Paenibacillus tyrfis TaxID=1501230 RepID=UPI000B58AF71|nr:hypothetical protein [Paenibacillus tyrfis]
MKKSLFTLSVATFTLMSSLLPISTSAGTYYGGRPSGNFNVYYDQSVNSYGYQHHLDDGKNQWSNITPKVSITYVQDTSSAPDKAYVSETSRENLLGSQTPYKKNFWGISPANNSDVWYYSTITLYDNNIKNASYMTKVAIATHEFGHALALADNSSSNKQSIMAGELDSDQNINNYSPTNYDTQDLISKYGR